METAAADIPAVALVLIPLHLQQAVEALLSSAPALKYNLPTDNTADLPTLMAPFKIQDNGTMGTDMLPSPVFVPNHHRGE